MLARLVLCIFSLHVDDNEVKEDEGLLYDKSYWKKYHEPRKKLNLHGSLRPFSDDHSRIAHNG